MLELGQYSADRAPPAVNCCEKRLLQSALRGAGGTQTRAAEMLKLRYRSFRHMINKYDLA